MKRLFTLFAILLQVLTSMAFDSAFDLTLPRNGNYRIYFDEKPYNFNGNTFSFQQFPSGAHQLKVDLINNSTFGQTLYNGLIYFEQDLRINASLESGGRLNITGKVPLGGYTGFPGYFPPGPPPPNWNNGYLPPWFNQNTFTSDTDYKALLSALNNAWFENQKQDIAMQAIKGNNFSAGQIKGILEIFWFDNSKLTVAKEAYKYSRDRGNFFKVYDAFGFSSTANALSAYIKDFKE